MDGCNFQSHDRGQVTVITYPPSYTRKHQPMRMGIIVATKVRYRTKLLAVRVGTMQTMGELRQQAKSRDISVGIMGLADGHRAHFFFSTHIFFPASGQAVVTGVVPSPPRFLPSIIIAHRVQQSHYSSIFHRVLLTHALALSASQFVHKKKSPRIYSSEYALGGIRTHETDLYQARG